MKSATTALSFICLLLLLLVIGDNNNLVHAAPWLMLTSSGTKCFMVHSPAGRVITLTYEAPDIQEQDGDDDKVNKKVGSTGKGAGGAGSLMDLYDQQREKLIQKHQARLADDDAHHQYGSEPDISMHMHQLVPDGPATPNPKGTNKLRHGVRHKWGQLTFRTGVIGGEVEVCILAFDASRKSPQRVSVDLRDMSEQAFDTKEQEKKPKRPMMPMESVNLDSLHKLDKHMSAITTDLYYQVNSVDVVSRNLETTKTTELTFHEKSVKLSKAIRYWPVIRMAVILVAGFLQVNHVVNYMKSRRIY